MINGMKFIKKNFLLLILIVIIFSVPILSFAQDIQPINNGDIQPINDSSGTIVNPIGVSSITGLIKTILEGLVKIGIPIVALAIIYCGFLFVSARGKPEAIKKAKDALLYTLIGAAILLGSWAIAQLISETVLELGK